jgi:glycosyltransferase involved in cell wall biosynthesis
MNDNYIDNIKFSIIVPTYNRANLIGDTLQSLIDQSYSNFELLIIDDGSTDNTEDLIKEWLIKDQRFKYYKKQNGERGAARNYGIQHANGAYITFIDSDDIAYPNYLENAYKELTKLSMPEFYAQAYETREKATNNLISSTAGLPTGTLNKEILKGNFLSCIGVFTKSDILKSLSFEEDRNFAGTEDWLLWLLLSARYPLHYNNTVTACMIEHDSRSVLSFPEEKLKYRADHLRKCLITDNPFKEKYGIQTINRIYAHMLTYASLHLAMSRKKSQAINYLIKASKINLQEVLSRRTLAIIKKIILN